MSAEANKALVRRFYEEIDKGNLAAMDELVADDYVDHSPPPFPGLSTGRAGLKQAFEIFWVATPGQHRIEDQIAEGDKVVTRIRATGTHANDLPGIPKTGNKLETTATVTHRIEDGRLAEKWRTRTSLASSSNSASFLRPLKLTPLLAVRRHRRGFPHAQAFACGPLRLDAVQVIRWGAEGASGFFRAARGASTAEPCQSRRPGPHHASSTPAGLR